LRWHWPAGVQEVQLSYAARSTFSIRGEKTVRRESYEKLGYYDLPIEGGEACLLSTDWDLRVSCCAPGETPLGETGGSPADGCSLVLRLSTQTVLTYQILPPTLWRKHAVLQILIDLPKDYTAGKRQSVPPLPPLLLVSRQGELPRLRTDGELF